MGFNASRADITNPVSPEQTQQAYLNTQTGLGQQQDFLKALQAQNGLSNQSNVFNQLQGVASGTGPNPAQAQLANATGANVANQAAMAAGQRGAGANVGMMQRQAANQGAGIQQNAAGQAAALQAQQSLGALNQMGGLATNQANQQANATNAFTNASLGQQQNLLGGVGAYNNAAVNMQGNINSTNAGISGVTAGAQGNMMQGLGSSLGSAAQMIPGMFSGGSGAMTGSQVGGTGFGDMMGSGTDALSMVAAKGGMVPSIPKKYADGGNVSGTTQLQDPSGPQSAAGKSFMQSQDELGAFNPAMQAPAPAKAASNASSNGIGGLMNQVMGGAQKAMNAYDLGSKLSDFGEWLGNGVEDLGSYIAAPAAEGVSGVMAGEAAALPAEGEGAATMVAAKGGRVPALVSPGEQYLKPKDVEQVKKGADPLKKGERIPGKPKVKGNSYSNDTVSKRLESGGIIIPNSIMQSKDASAKAAKFVEAILAKQGLKPSLKGK